MAHNDTLQQNQPGKPHRVRTVLVVLAICVFVVGVGFGIFYFLVRTLNPSTSAVASVQGAKLIRLDPVLVDARDVTRLEVSAGSSYLSITPSPDLEGQHSMRITESYPDDGSEHQTVTWDQTGNVLRINHNEQGKTIWSNKVIEIEVAPSMLESLEVAAVDCTSGEIKARDLDCSQLCIAAQSGSVSVEGARADSLQLELSSGTAALSGTFDEMDVVVSSGDASLKVTGEPSNIVCTVSSGDVELSLLEGVGFTARTRADAGDVTFEQQIAEGAEGVVTCGDGKTQMDLTAATGNIRVTLADSL